MNKSPYDCSGPMRISQQVDHWRKRALEAEAEVRSYKQISKIQWDAIELYKIERDRLREALSWYADKEAWHKAVLDSLSGELDFFDWPGDLADEPWEIAEKVLAGREE